MRHIQINGFTRISKQAAIKRFKLGENFAICPCKMVPGGPYSMHSVVYGETLEERLNTAAIFNPLPTNPTPLQMKLWKEETIDVAWNRLIKQWTFYNASNETGYYPAFYIEA